jgi:hypothetical protein
LLFQRLGAVTPSILQLGLAGNITMMSIIHRSIASGINLAAIDVMRPVSRVARPGWRLNPLPSLANIGRLVV